MSPALNLLAVGLALIGAVVAWTFVLVYSRPPFVWRTYEAGRHLMRFTAGIAIILTWSLVALVLLKVFGRPDWLLSLIDIGRVVIYGWIAIMIASRLRLLLVARKAGTHHDHDEEPPADLERRDPDDDDVSIQPGT